MYRLLLIVFYPISLLPLWVLYGLSEVAYFLLYRVFGYRRAVVRSNLEHAFPQKSAAEITGIERRFYRSFCDQWVETWKLLSMSRKELNRRVKGNWEVFEALNASGQDAYALLGHTFNWEWACVACQWNAPQQFAGVYLPLSNTAFDRLMQRIRTRGKGWLISMKALKSGLQQLRGTRHIIGMIADQNPSQPGVALWLPFMNREAPFFRGPEQMARRAKGAVVFAGIRKLKRGHYEIKLEKKLDDASQTSTEEITRAYVAFMEAQLQVQPENWMWTHKRWKHRKEQF